VFEGVDTDLDFVKCLEEVDFEFVFEFVFVFVFRVEDRSEEARVLVGRLSTALY
jgi:hypothetical protein